MLTTSATNGKAMDETKLQKYKTVLCQRMLRSGTCRYGLQCDFAHDKFELRRNFSNIGIMDKSVQRKTAKIMNVDMLIMRSN